MWDVISTQDPLKAAIVVTGPRWAVMGSKEGPLVRSVTWIVHCCNNKCCGWRCKVGQVLVSARQERGNDSAWPRCSMATRPVDLSEQFFND